MPPNNQKLQDIIEQLCTTGCDRVNEVIEILERQESIKETSELNEQECTIVLLELKAIMAVYEQE
ncbi:MAG: hypothetical protein OEY06_10435 [Gammaproteobacteria bacterium]|nr:hypothetical protein [Gammaproteobacteria bacterium]